MSPIENDPLRPDEFSSLQVSTLSQSTWHALLSSARYQTHLPHSCSDIRSLLNQTPSIPGSHQVTETIGGSSMFLEGYSTWTVPAMNVTSNPRCELPLTKQALPRKVYVGESCPGTCSLSNDSFGEWPGLQSLPEPAGNYLAVFVLGWSYVFSARLIELRGRVTADRIVYTDDLAQWIPGRSVNDGELFDLDIGCDSLAAGRWWAAILAGRRGWEASFSRQHEIYFSPWELHLNNSSIRICQQTELPSPVPNFEPPSSAEAQEYLCNLARLHDAFDQLVCALAAVMTLPTQNRFGASVTLPRPVASSRPTSAFRSHLSTELTFLDQIPKFTEIPQYMVFSATSGLLASCLLGSFWEPSIPCNLASEWLNPAMKEITSSLFQSGQSFPIIWAMSARRPRLASLWLGATITGLLPRIIQVSQSFLPTIFLEAVVWTESPQSFMDPPNHRNVKSRIIGDRVTISREDEFRLLYLTDTLSHEYGNPPICPYSPFGDVDIRDISLQARLHISCNHKLSYRSWEWKCHKGQLLSDSGARNPFEVSRRTGFNLNSLPSIWILAGLAHISRSDNSWAVNLMKRVSRTLERQREPLSVKHTTYD